MTSVLLPASWLGPELGKHNALAYLPHCVRCHCLPASPREEEGKVEGKDSQGGGAFAFSVLSLWQMPWSHPTNIQLILNALGASTLSHPKVRAEGHLSILMH